MSLDNRTFTEKVMGPPAEEEEYASYFIQNLWSIDEFSSLLSGITPKNYKEKGNDSLQISDIEFSKREAFATKIFSMFLADIEKKPSMTKDVF